jgi:hypothetical protein
MEVKHYNERRPHNHLPNRSSPKQFEKELVSLGSQDRPMEIVYSEGNYKNRAAHSANELKHRTGPQVPVCPIVNN